MNPANRKDFAGPLWIVAVFVGAAATLRYAQEFFQPLVLAGLLSFLLSPLVVALSAGDCGAWDRCPALKAGRRIRVVHWVFDSEVENAAKQ